MISFTGVSIINEKNEVYLGENKKDVLNELGIVESSIISVNENSSYVTIENVYLANLMGKCKLLFINDNLAKISFVPTLGEFIKELGQITRQGLYSCVDRGYKHIKKFFDKENSICISSDSVKSVYKLNENMLIVAIENNRENLIVETEALK